MLTIKKYIFIFLISIFLLVGFVPAVHAHCPICTAAVGAAAVSAKYYGLDTSIIGLFVGAFAISTGLWVGLKIKKTYFKFQLPIIVLVSFLLTAIPLMSLDKDSIYFPLLLFGQTGSIFNKVYWINKIFLGSIIGSFITLAAFWLHTYIKKIKGKVLFPFQGIVITIVFLLAASLGLYYSFGA